jgi:uncharacterized membrane protein
MVCQHCERLSINQCMCLAAKPVSKIETFGMLILFQILTGGISFILFYLQGVSIIEAIPWMALTLITYLGGLSLLTRVFHKSYVALFFGCHQSIKRSFHFKGKPFHICSRCTGLYVGFLLTSLLFFIEIPIILIVALSLPLIIDGSRQKLTNYESTPLKRFVTGALFSGVVTLLILCYNYLILLAIQILS